MTAVVEAPARCPAPSVTRYNRGCPCLGCRAEKARDAALRRAARRLHPESEPRMVDAAPVRAAVHTWRTEGFYWREIAETLMLSVPRTIDIAQNEATTVDRRLAAQIGALRPIRHRPQVPEGMVEATGSVRRLRGLARLGFGCEEIAAHYGLGTKRLGEIRNAKCSWVTEATHDAIRNLTMELVVRPPVAGTEEQRRKRATVASRARSKNWSSLAAWEDLDDPACEPSGDVFAAA